MTEGKASWVGRVSRVQKKKKKRKQCADEKKMFTLAARQIRKKKRKQKQNYRSLKVDRFERRIKANTQTQHQAWKAEESKEGVMWGMGL